MLRTILPVLLTLTVALGTGAGSVLWAVDRDIDFATISNGAWTAAPELGTRLADPYARARFSRQAELRMGVAEGIVFEARSDSSGHALHAACRYEIAGSFPPARFWTLHLRDAGGAVLRPPGRRAPALQSRNVLRGPDGRTVVALSGPPSPGNWLRIAGTDAFGIVLSLYDLAGASRVEELDLPSIERVSCDG